MDGFDVFLDNLLSWLARTVRSNLLFGAIVVVIVGALASAAGFVFTH
jgi:hypothetical protein